MKIFHIILLILFFSCSSINNRDKTTIKSVDTITIPKLPEENIALHPLKKMFTVGDFDRDGIKDTIFQHTFSKLTGKEIDSAADPFQNEWDTVIQWFQDQDSDVCLTFNKNKSDTLHLGMGQGLYCLFNLGDTNSDGKDEIAFVVDYCDYSSLNSCKIYSLCNNKWVLLKYFGIHEGSFDYTTDEVQVPDNIKNHLAKRDGKWVYMDCLQDDVTSPDDGKTIPLKTELCN